MSPRIMTPTFKLEENVFAQPQGNVRGFLIAMVTYSNGKEKRLAHSYLLVDQISRISLDVPKTAEVTDLPVIQEALAAFTKRLSELSGTAGGRDR